jgi:hypothetical protein
MLIHIPSHFRPKEMVDKYLLRLLGAKMIHKSYMSFLQK